MALLVWDEKYSVGVKVWDEQHAVLIGILNDFHSAVLRGHAQSATGPLLEKLLEYVHYHFSTEERMMTAAGHPMLPQHRAIHLELTAQVVEFVGRYEDGDTTISIPLLKFLRDWLKNHILKEDRVCAAWMNQHGVH